MRGDLPDRFARSGSGRARPSARGAGHRAPPPPGRTHRSSSSAGRAGVKQVARPLSQLAQLLNTILQAIAGAERVFEILDEQPEIVDLPDALALPEVEGHVVFDRVDFSYVPGIQVLYDNSFEAQPGQMIGLCGPTGAGKSTIITS